MSLGFSRAQWGSFLVTNSARFGPPPSPYTALAFHHHEYKKSMDAEERHEHKIHTFGGGGVVFFVGKAKEEEGRERRREGEKEKEFMLCSHANYVLPHVDEAEVVSVNECP